MIFNYNIIEHSSVIIIYYYKVGSRFLDTYFSSNFGITTGHDNMIPYPNFKKYSINLSKTNSEFITNLKIGNYYIEPDMILTNDTVLKNILKNELVDIPILLIYRDPYQKTISGLVEDFHEEFMRGDTDSAVYIDVNAFYKYIEDTKYSKIYLTFLNKICNGSNTMDTFNLMSTDSDLEQDYILLLKKYVEYRISINQIGKTGHTQFHTHSVFIMLNEFNKNQKYVLVNLDDTCINFQNILDTYCRDKKTEYINKNDFSNTGYKTKLDNVLDLKIKEELYKILENEMYYYNMLNHQAIK